MEGAAQRQAQQLDAATFASWHTALFALQAYAGKLKPLGDYLGGPKKKPTALQHAQGIAFFHSLKARGIPVSITKKPN